MLSLSYLHNATFSPKFWCQKTRTHFNLSDTILNPEYINKVTLHIKFILKLKCTLNLNLTIRCLDVYHKDKFILSKSVPNLAFEVPALHLLV